MGSNQSRKLEVNGINGHGLYVDSSESTFQLTATISGLTADEERRFRDVGFYFYIHRAKKRVGDPDTAYVSKGKTALFTDEQVLQLDTINLEDGQSYYVNWYVGNNSNGIKIYQTEPFTVINTAVKVRRPSPALPSALPLGLPAPPPKVIPKLTVTCPSGHDLVKSLHTAPWYCNAAYEAGGCLCGGSSLFTRIHSRWRCSDCDYDYCGPCYDVRLGNLRLRTPVRYNLSRKKIELSTANNKYYCGQTYFWGPHGKCGPIRGPQCNNCNGLDNSTTFDNLTGLPQVLPPQNLRCAAPNLFQPVNPPPPPIRIQNPDRLNRRYDRIWLAVDTGRYHCNKNGCGRVRGDAYQCTYCLNITASSRFNTAGYLMSRSRNTLFYCGRSVANLLEIRLCGPEFGPQCRECRAACDEPVFIAPLFPRQDLPRQELPRERLREEPREDSKKRKRDDHLMEMVKEKSKITRTDREILKPYFQLIDRNSNNEISFEELYLYLNKMGNFGREEVRKMMEEADVNDDKIIDLDEFIAIAKMGKSTLNSRSDAWDDLVRKVKEEYDNSSPRWTRRI